MNNENPKTYPKFLAMIATSTVVMMILMYLNTYAIDHVFWSETRVRELADEIIKAQRKEIDEMKTLIADLEANK